jgi:AcrR family transcriptional regulator
MIQLYHKSQPDGLMPKRVNHEWRKRAIAEALLQVASSAGLHATGMREVAKAAGMSVRLIQYYFETKEKLLLFGIEYLGEKLTLRVRQRLESLGHPPTPRDVVETVLIEALPADDERRMLHMVYTAYHVLALTDPVLAAQPFLVGPNAVEHAFAAQIRMWLPEHGKADDFVVRAEAVGLLAMSAGLGTSVLANQRSAEEALAILRFHLDRVFGLAGTHDPDIAAVKAAMPKMVTGETDGKSS